ALGRPTRACATLSLRAPAASGNARNTRPLPSAPAKPEIRNGSRSACAAAAAAHRRTPPLCRSAGRLRARGIQMLAGLIDQFEQYLALPGEAHAPLLQRSFN